MYQTWEYENILPIKCLLKVRLFQLLKKVIIKFKFYIYLKKLKNFFFSKAIFFLTYINKLKTNFLDTLIIFKKLSQYMKINFLIKKVVFYPKNHKLIHPK